MPNAYLINDPSLKVSSLTATKTEHQGTTRHGYHQCTTGNPVPATFL